MIKDLNELLDRIPIWKKLQGMPDRMEALEKRIVELELRLERAPGDACPRCGAREMRLEKQGRRVGSEPNSWRYDTWKCGECGQADERKVTF